jgi:hypothetical protein
MTGWRIYNPTRGKYCYYGLGRWTKQGKVYFHKNHLLTALQCIPFQDLENSEIQMIIVQTINVKNAKEYLLEYKESK